jgi:glycosyltransferase involved in cell wall biosynthesis
VLKQRLVSAGFDSTRICINPNGADPELFSPAAKAKDLKSAFGVEDAVVVGFCGTYGPWHGVEHLAHAIPRIIAETSKIRFLFVGDQRLRTEVGKIVEENGTKSYLWFAENIPHGEIPEYLSACDILVSPHVTMADGSEFFGSPIKIFEYMAMGKPIVASRVGQISEILYANVNALLVEPGDPAQLADAILRLAGDFVLRNKLGAEARQTLLSNYTWKHNARRFLDCCRLANCVPKKL